jgi:eukaryotic-like serine/threonine-protein kinase
MPERGTGPRVSGFSSDQNDTTSQVPTRLEPAGDTGDQLPPPEPKRVPPLQLETERGSLPATDPKNLPPAIPGYQILGELGHGGMGVVYQARQVSLDRLVALKMIRSADLASPHDLARFRSEADAVARLKHPNIVQIYDVGNHEGRPFFSLEYVEGGSLAQKVKGIPQPPRAAAELVEVLARAVHAAHQRGIVHRDLKPANVLLTADGVPKITDFGIAKRLDLEAGQTRTGTVMGTPSYMAPEQAAGKTKEIGPAVDVYSLGAILYELLTGRPPFLAESWQATRDLVLSTEPVAPRRLQPKLPRDLQTICLKCLQKEPRKRYATGLALAEELRCYVEGKPIRSRPVTTAERVWRWARRSPKLATASGLAVAALAAAVVVSINFMIYQAQVNRDQADELRKSQIRSAELALDTGLRLCEQGEGGQGILWLARSLELAPPDEYDLRWAARANLAAWRSRINSLENVLPQEGEVAFVAFSPDGKTLLTASENETRLWEAGTGRPEARLLPHRGRVLAAHFSIDGKTIVTRNREKTQRWDAATGEAIGPALDPNYVVSSAVFGADGETIITGSRERRAAQLWQATTGARMGQAFEHIDMGWVIAVALSHDGKTALTGSWDGAARLWDIATGKCLDPPFRLAGPHQAVVYAVAFSPDDKKIITGSGDKAAHLWDVGTRQPVGQPFYHRDIVTAVAFGPDGSTILTGSEDGSARLWAVDSGKPIGTPLVHRAGIKSVAFNPDGKTVLTGSADKTARLWRIASPIPKLCLSHDDQVFRVTFSPDGKTALTASLDGKVRLWDGETGRLCRFLQHDGPVFDASFSPDGQKVLTRSSDRTARLWNAVTGEPIKSFSHEEGVVQVVGFGPDWTTIVTGSSDGTAKVWNAVTGEQIKCLPHDGAVYAASFGPDGKTILTASGDRAGRIWDVATGTIRAHLPHADDAKVVCAIFSLDGALVLTGDEQGTAHLWDATTGGKIGESLQHQGVINAMAFSPDGQTVLTGGNDRVARMWDTHIGKARRVLEHHGTISSLAYSPDGRMVLTGSEDHTARLWNVATGRPIGPALLHANAIYTVAFGPDGKAILTGSSDNIAALWEIPQPVAEAGQRLMLWTNVMTGMELDETGPGGVSLLDAKTWQGHSKDLRGLGGPPVP